MYKTSKEDEKKIVMLYEGGALKKDISKEFHITLKTIQSVLRRNGIDLKNSIRYSKEVKDKAQEMALNGASDVEIAEETGISLNIASTYVKRVEKEIELLEEDENLVRAIPLEKIRYLIVDGISYTDVTDFVAGI